jgi:hypothetical protein
MVRGGVLLAPALKLLDHVVQWISFFVSSFEVKYHTVLELDKDQLQLHTAVLELNHLLEQHQVKLYRHTSVILEFQTRGYVGISPFAEARKDASPSMP